MASLSLQIKMGRKSRKRNRCGSKKHPQSQGALRLSTAVQQCMEANRREVERRQFLQMLTGPKGKKRDVRNCPTLLKFPTQTQESADTCARSLQPRVVIEDGDTDLVLY